MDQGREEPVAVRHCWRVVGDGSNKTTEEHGGISSGHALVRTHPTASSEVGGGEDLTFLRVTIRTIEIIKLVASIVYLTFGREVFPPVGETICSDLSTSIFERA